MQRLLMAWEEGFIGRLRWREFPARCAGGRGQHPQRPGSCGREHRTRPSSLAVETCRADSGGTSCSWLCCRAVDIGIHPENARDTVHAHITLLAPLAIAIGGALGNTVANFGLRGR